MTKHLLGLFAAAALIAAVPFAARSADKDHDALQGTWKVEKATRGGEDMPDEERDSTKVEFKGDKVIVHHKDREDPAEFTLDASKTPKQIRIKPAAADKAHAGIYELKGDMLKICVVDGDEPPAKFESPKDTKTMLILLKREKK